MRSHVQVAGEPPIGALSGQPAAHAIGVGMVQIPTVSTKKNKRACFASPFCFLVPISWMRSRVYVARPPRLFFHSKIIQNFSITTLICQNRFRQNAQQQKSPQKRPAFLLKSPRPKGYDKGMTNPPSYIM